ncbi:MAG TPA: hypothetical protein VE934_10200 [Polaromonas sp.]|uniref:hypothetical protein n=1 Tax=Polaromonas sp. TaxID=1869339 RepID=UPI002D695E1F|nr:hypothetical protein [Polaromonas sp.]HYW57323.1 hypothetical protein [Polaromonas sp.]
MDTATRIQAPREIPAKYAHIPGWGADLDHADRPAYPMERMPARLEGAHQHEPVPQEQNVEVLLSSERPAMTPLFGTTLPPSGLSGMLRRFAFRFSENDIRHWMILLFADRVNVVEGLGSDLKKGHIPNVFAEMGIKAEFKHNRPAFVTKVAVASAAGVLIVLWMRSRRR